MAGEDLPLRIDPRADGLRQSEHDAAHQRAPQAAQPADDHGFEGIKQPCRSDRRIEIGADAELNGARDARREGPGAEPVSITPVQRRGSVDRTGGAVQEGAQAIARRIEIGDVKEVENLDHRFDLHPDGKRVATIAAPEQADSNQDKVVFVFNFFDYLRRIAPTWTGQS